VIKRSAGVLLVAVVPLLGACATVPAGPSVMVLPGSGKPFEVFQADDDSCRQWAFSQGGAGPNDRWRAAPSAEQLSERCLAGH
jgi:hypothetical protein